MRKKGFGMNDLDWIVISGAGPGIGKRSLWRLGVVGLMFGAFPERPTVRSRRQNRFVRLFNFWNAMPTRLES
jgi:hypothetical protein